MSSWDYIVIGAGIMGAFTAYNLAKNGYKVLILEQFTAPNTRGSSHGKTRQIFKALADKHKASMMEEAYKLWLELEKESSLKIFVNTGLLIVGKADSKLVQFNEQLKINKPLYEYQFMTGEEVSRQFPIFTFDNNYCGLLDKSGGMIKADNSIIALYAEIKKRGGEIHDKEPVIEFKQLSDSEIKVKSVMGTYTANGLVVTAGPWAAKVLDLIGIKLPLTCLREDVWFHKQEKEHDSSHFEFPAFMMFDDKNLLFSLPVLEHPGMAKVVFNGGSAIDPDNRFLDPEPDKQHLSYVAQFLRLHMPKISSTPIVAEKGIVTFTPDRNFIVDRHPKFENIVIGAGFSGRGFQFAPVIGKVLAELVTRRKPSYDLEPFSLKRFLPKQPSINK